MYFNILAINSKHKYRNQTTIGSWNQSFPQKLESSDLNKPIASIRKSIGLTYVLSCLTKLEKLLCLKYLGSKSEANSGGSHTIKLQPLSLHDTTEFVNGSSTSSYVFIRKGAGALELPCDPSILASTVVQNLKPKSVYKYLLAHTKDNIQIRLAIGSNLRQLSQSKSGSEKKVMSKKKFKNPEIWNHLIAPYQNPRLKAASNSLCTLGTKQYELKTTKPKTPRIDLPQNGSLICWFWRWRHKVK